jgi:hypothetical protein
LSPLLQQLGRIPFAISGTVAGAAAGSAGIAVGP